MKNHAKNKNYLICIVGPTAIGKTALGVQVAKHFNCDVLSADSRQFYKELSIGTAKPTIEEMDGVPHHFIDNLSITTEYNAGQFERDSIVTLDKIFQHNNIQVLVGGSGLYVNALCFGFDDLPDIDSTTRASVIKDYEEKGIDFLQSTLQEVDPIYYKTAPIKNPQRLMRALEIYRQTGKPYSSFKTGESKQRNFTPIFIGLNSEREALYNRINLRVDKMMEDGLLDEVKSVESFKNHSALKTVGYQEFYDHFEGKYSLEEAIDLVKRNTRRYAKRQITWFKKTPEINWFTSSDVEAILAHIQKVIS